MVLYNAYNAQYAYEMQEEIITRPDGLASFVKLNKKVLFPIIPFLTYEVQL
jgi:hypothetical protein